MMRRPLRTQVPPRRPAPAGWRPAWWGAAGWGAPEAPEVVRVKLRGYLFALLCAAPGLTLLLLDLLDRAAWLTAGLHLGVMAGSLLLFVLVWRRPARLPLAERVFAGLLTLSGVGFLGTYAQRPEQVLSFELLGNVLLFIVAGLLLVLPPRASIPLAVGLLITYRLEVSLLSGVAPEQLRTAQWVNTGMFSLLVVGVVMRGTLSELAGRTHALRELASRDALTGLLNRRGFEEQTGDQPGRERGALLLLDVDSFKAVNDRHGHAAGDEVLAAVGRVLAGHVPGGAVAARWGGEEFIVWAPLDLGGAARLAERLRAAVERAVWNDLRVTVSVGVSDWPAGEDLRGAFRQADDALYAAKRGGRNRVVLAGADSP
ncbi:hypothetical protein CBQ26_14580 [Deinococcus indicus]|uniref:GGDEF domain-containing protein n=2 Tax=Deinococcus indicus TaxID=223556 RepID=A0A246BHK6_9DEIO|nr:hypothetical protein CBQ26_14580 [Deinococcus indicus]